MAANFLDAALLFGTGAIGALLGLYSAGQKLADHIASFAASLEQALRDPRHVDLDLLAQKAREVEKDAKTLLGMLRQVFKT
jgi:hypothetical protein